jgi:hypothetical protein
MKYGFRNRRETLMKSLGTGIYNRPVTTDYRPPGHLLLVTYHLVLVASICLSKSVKSLCLPADRRVGAKKPRQSASEGLCGPHNHCYVA